ncbi:MAG: glutamate formiminotransferase, partial [Pseudothermotoga sp.]
AQRYGVPVVGTEIIGMVPMQAMLEVAQYYLQLDDFGINRIIENRVMDILAREGAQK